jgi:hypothetical protein
VKVIPKKISTDFQSNNGYSIRTLHLNESFQFPNKLKCESLNALLLGFSFQILFNYLFLEKIFQFEGIRALRC